MAKRVIYEKYLLDALDRVARNPSGYSVLYIHISKLRPKNRHPEFVKIFAKLFDSVAGNAKGTLFILSNGDFAILGRDITHEVIDEAVLKLRDGLSTDPILHTHDSKDFFEIYDFPKDFVSFYEYIAQMKEQALLVVRQDEVNQKRPVRVDEIDDLITALDFIDISEIVKRQSVLKIGMDKSFHVWFQEFFVAVKDLVKKFDPQLDLLANRWLFYYFTQALDKKTMAAFSTSSLKNWPKVISLNLNLSSVFSQTFVNFAKNFLKPEQKIIVEVQLMDVFNNLSTYFKAKEILRSGGHKLLIDAVSPMTLKMLNIAKLDPDLVKIFWEPLLEYDVDNEELRKIIAHVGRENVILAKCDDEKSIKWGVKYGITSFQGPYIDSLEVALLRRQCPNAKNCSMAECLKRKRLLSGWYREGCHNKECLETIL